MKLVLVLLLLLGIGLVVMFYSGGTASFDPTQQGLDAKAAITPGMTWPQVLAAAGKPGRWARIVLEKKKDPFSGVETLVPVEKAASDYRDGSIDSRLKAGELPDGFVVYYTFSKSVAFKVSFDGAGLVERLNDLRTEVDLLDMRNP